MTRPVAETGYNPAAALFRQAVTARKLAEIWAAGGDRLRQDPNPRGRERDAVTATIVVTHAAIETAWRWEQQAANLDRSYAWPEEYDDAISAIAATRGRPEPPPTPDDRLTRFLVLADWRTFFQHGSREASQRLAKRLGWPAWDNVVLDNLDAAYAAHVVELADEVFEHLASATGGQRVGPSSALWIGW